MVLYIIIYFFQILRVELDRSSGMLNLDLSGSAVGGAEGPDRIFVGGLPYYFTEAQIRELLQSFGYGLKSSKAILSFFFLTVLLESPFSPIICDQT